MRSGLTEAVRVPSLLLMRFASVVPAAALSLALAGPSFASTFPGLESQPFAFTPRVPVSGLVAPAAWLDPSRLHFSTSVSVGSGFGGGAQGLQVSSLTYSFKAPMALRVSVGNAFGGPGAWGQRNGLFLEGVDFAWRPSASTSFQIGFHDYRSPLQLARDPFGRDLWGY